MPRKVIDLRTLQDDFVVHYGGELNRVNAYTFANSLVALANAIRATNALVHPGHDIEIAIEALARGSFRARIRTKKFSIGNLFSAQGAATGLIVGLLGNYIFRAMNPDEPRIIVKDDSVIFEYNDARVILPKQAHGAYEQTKGAEQIRDSIAEAFEVLDKDDSVKDFGITTGIKDKEPLIYVPRDRFAQIARSVREEPGSREIEMRASLQIVRAILERSPRLWEFVSQGTRISAPVTDSKFYDDLAARKISLATGDALDATLRIHQRPIEGTDIFENTRYEVVKVHSHLPRMSQTTLSPPSRRKR